MPNTFALLASSTVGAGGTSSIDFTSIPQTYTDLCLQVSTRTTNSNGGRDYFCLRFNNSSSTEYSYIWMVGYDATLKTTAIVTGNTSARSLTNPDSQTTANVFGNAEIYIPSYTSSNYKNIHSSTNSENNSSTTWIVNNSANLWANTSAINRITILPGDPAGTGNFAQYSTAYLYGIKNS